MRSSRRYIQREPQLTSSKTSMLSLKNWLPLTTIADSCPERIQLVFLAGDYTYRYPGKRKAEQKQSCAREPLYPVEIGLRQPEPARLCGRDTYGLQVLRRIVCRLYSGEETLK